MAGDLPLDELLGERYVRHYLRILASANSLFYVVPDPETPGEWTTTVLRPSAGETGRDPDPVIDKRGSGPADCSSSTTLAEYPMHCWDVRGYYARLQVHWKATRRELREAYIARGGPDDPRLTYAFKQLLNDDVRRAYDRTPLGAPWLDEEVQAEIKQQAAREAARRVASGATLTDSNDVLREWGYIRVDKDPGVAQRSGQPLRPPAWADQDDTGAATSKLGATISDWEVNWGWYLLGDIRPPGRPGDRLEQWQRLLVQAVNDADLQLRFAVGFFSGDRFRLWRNTSNLCIFFLASHELPTPSLASEAVHGYLSSRAREESYANRTQGRSRR